MQEGSKGACRARSVSGRARLSTQEHAATAAAVLQQVRAVLAVLPPGPVAAYASVGTEPGTRPLLDELARGPRPVLLPLLRADGDLDWALLDGGLHEGALRPGPRGLAQPAGPALGLDAVADCVLVLVPALAVDRRGTRLGRGGGSYDRALARASGPVLAALHPGELVDRLPAEPHDRPVDGAVLPGAGLVRLRPHPAFPPTAVAGGMSP